jgi:hypothetical protein
VTELFRRPKPKARPKGSQPSTPLQLPAIDNADIFALQAVAKGKANEGQQQRAWNYITRALCGTDVMSFWPGGDDGRRASDFAEGKRWVGIQLRRIERLRPDMSGLGLPPSHENPENP